MKRSSKNKLETKEKSAEKRTKALEKVCKDTQKQTLEKREKERQKREEALKTHNANIKRLERENHHRQKSLDLQFQDYLKK